MSTSMTRAREQIRMGEELARERDLDRNNCVDAAHFLIPDGGAARQGDDPEALTRWGLADLLPRAVEIEREAARSWSEAEWAEIADKLAALGPSRSADLQRLAAHRAVS